MSADLCSNVSKEEIRTGCVTVLSDGHSPKMIQRQKKTLKYQRKLDENVTEKEKFHKRKLKNEKKNEKLQ